PVGDVTFQRVKLYVTAGLSTDGVMRRYEMSQPASKGETVEITGKGLLAKCFCHELDHLDGKLYTDVMIRALRDDELEKYQ
ncbi:MAG: peptide deformylase, partial [Clostridia bacterium]|nr:peptide deformylase [Clostridia bacterium]